MDYLSVFMAVVVTLSVVGLIFGSLQKKVWVTSFSNLTVRLLKLVIPIKEIQESVIGDLLEESKRFPSSIKATIWLYKQALISALPLLLQAAKNRIASYFGERVR
jgi:hypothetical protein